MDLALYRAISSVTGEVTRVFPAENEDVGPRLQVRLDTAVQSILRAEVNQRPVAAVELYGEREVVLTLPKRLRSADVPTLELAMFAEKDFKDLEGQTVPGMVGIGNRAALLDGPAEAVQRAIRELMMAPGTDTWNPNRGGGLIFLRQYTLMDINEISRLVSVAVDKYNRGAGSATRSAKRTSRVSAMSVRSVRLLDLVSLRREFRIPATVGRSLLPGGSERAVSINLSMVVSGLRREELSSSFLV